jgi:hypothetical protein
LTTIPSFRVRVFLSVDLSGSTEFKARSNNNDWIRHFQKFYTDFLKNFRRQYTEFCEKNTECQEFSEKVPNLWKTIGDEAVFVNRVDSLFHLFAYIHSFEITLKEYRLVLRSLDDRGILDVKGNAWIASFPYPNQTIPRPEPNKHGLESPLIDEETEVRADESPYDYDFLGSGIDAGFRISKMSNPSLMTLSPVLACLLARANTIHDLKPKYEFKFQFLGTTTYKGVLSGAQYPIVGLNTESDHLKDSLSRLQDSLTGANPFNANDFIGYLEGYIKLHGIDMPEVSINDQGIPFRPPSSYTAKFVPYWEGLKADLETSDKALSESFEDHDDEGSNSDDQQPSVTDLLRELSNIYSASKDLLGD